MKLCPSVTPVKMLAKLDLTFLCVSQADADDIDTWMLDILRIVSSVDVGHNEFSTQALVKKHKDVAEEIGSYRPVIDALHEQSRTLPPEKADFEEVKLFTPHHRGARRSDQSV